MALWIHFRICVLFFRVYLICFTDVNVAFFFCFSLRMKCRHRTLRKSGREKKGEEHEKEEKNEEEKEDDDDDDEEKEEEGETQ